VFIVAKNVFIMVNFFQVYAFLNREWKKIMEKMIGYGKERIDKDGGEG
jgi:hypothetical protein